MLLRFDPFREVDRLTRLWGPDRTPIAPLDVYREGDHYVVQIDLPGVAPESIDLTVEKDTLAVSAERRIPRGEGVELLVNERPEGSVRRQLFLGEGLDTEHIEASYDDGVLTVMVPVAETAKPRKVEIAAGATKAIDAPAA